MRLLSLGLILILALHAMGMPQVMLFGWALASVYYGLRHGKTQTFNFALISGLIIDLVTLTAWGVTSLILTLGLGMMYLVIVRFTAWELIWLGLLSGVSLFCYVIITGADWNFVQVIVLMLLVPLLYKLLTTLGASPQLNIGSFDLRSQTISRLRQYRQ